MLEPFSREVIDKIASSRWFNDLNSIRKSTFKEALRLYDIFSAFHAPGLDFQLSEGIKIDVERSEII